jgi:hypothetical protein
MSDAKARLQEGLERKKSRGAVILKKVLDTIKREGVLTESELSEKTGIDKRRLPKYTGYLAEKGLVSVKKRFLKDSVISISGHRDVRIKLAKEPAEKDSQGVLDSEGGIHEASADKVGGGGEGAAEDEVAGQATESGVSADSAGGKEEGAARMEGGEKILPATADEFRRVVESLTMDFRGMMRLHGEMEGCLYTAALMVDGGSVVAASFENLETVEVSVGDGAVDMIRDKFAGSRGELEIFIVEKDDFDRMLAENEDYALGQNVMLSDLRIRVKNNMPPEAEGGSSFAAWIRGAFVGSESGVKEERRKMLRKGVQGHASLMDFARSLSLDKDKARRFEDLRKNTSIRVKKREGGVDEKKSERFNMLRLARQGVERQGGALQKEQPGDLGAGGVKTILEKPLRDVPKASVIEGRMVSTKIDILYDMVKSNGKVRLNDALAAKIGVGKTQIEQWAMILEEHNLLEIRYPTIGEPEIISVKSDKNKGEKSEEG